MKNITATYKQQGSWQNDPKDYTISEAIIDKADSEYGVSNQLDRATTRARVLADTLDSLLSALFNKGILTAEEIIEIVPFDSEYDSHISIR